MSTRTRRGVSTVDAKLCAPLFVQAIAKGGRRTTMVGLSVTKLTFESSIYVAVRLTERRKVRSRTAELVPPSLALILRRTLPTYWCELGDTTTEGREESAPVDWYDGPCRAEGTESERRNQCRPSPVLYISVHVIKRSGKAHLDDAVELCDGMFPRRLAEEETTHLGALVRKNANDQLGQRAVFVVSGSTGGEETVSNVATAVRDERFALGDRES